SPRTVFIATPVSLKKGKIRAESFITKAGGGGVARSETVRDPQVDLCSGSFAIQSEVGAGIELQVVRAGRLPGTGHVQGLLQSRARRVEIRVLPVFSTRGDLGGNGAGDAKRRDTRRMSALAELILEN